MGRKQTLSAKFNMSWGFLPVLVPLLLCRWMDTDMSLYAGCGVGVVASACDLLRRRGHIRPFILHVTTGALALWSAVTWCTGFSCPHRWFPLMTEGCVLLAVLVFCLVERRLPPPTADLPLRPAHKAQALRANLVAGRIALLLGAAHLIVGGVLLCLAGASEVAESVSLQAAPPAVFVLAIVANQLGIWHFNRLSRRSRFFFVPIVTPAGDVVGKATPRQVCQSKDKYLTPIIRIALSAEGMLYLCPRPSHSLAEAGKTDVPLEGFLRFGETLEDGVRRLLNQHLPHLRQDWPSFHSCHVYHSQEASRLVYLFWLELTTPMADRLQGLKPWTFRQIKENLGKDYFSRCFEQECQSLEAAICKAGKCKES